MVNEKLSAAMSWDKADENDGALDERSRRIFQTSISINLRHRLVCDKIVACLAQESASHLQELWLGPTFASSQTVISAISSLPPSLVHLDLDLRNALHLIPVVSPILCSQKQIRSLSLRLHGDSGILELAKYIHNNPNLEQLDLRGNRIGSKGARALVDALVGCKHGIKRFMLSCNCILHGDMIAKLLSDESSQLESVDLSFNWIDDKAIQKVSQALSLKHAKLRELNLFGCQRISDVGVQHLLQCLKSSNTTLKDVNLHACGYRASRRIEELETLLALNRSGRYLLKCDLRSGAWPLVLAKFSGSPDVMYHFLQENPSLIL
jgi:hypothetical protein